MCFRSIAMLMSIQHVFLSMLLFFLPVVANCTGLCSFCENGGELGRACSEDLCGVQLHLHPAAATVRRSLPSCDSRVQPV